MRVLVTGHDGYIGAVLTPLLSAAGHEVVGLDNHLFGECAFDEVPEVEALSMDVRDVRADHLDGLRRGDAPRRDLQRPDRRPQPRRHVRHQPPRERAAGRGGQAGGRAALHLLLVVQPVRRRGGRRTRSTRRAAFNPRHPVRRVQGPGRARHLPLADDDFSPTFLRNATAYGVSPRCAATSWSTTSSAYAYCTGEVRHAERRQPVAAARAHRGHLPRLHRGLEAGDERRGCPRCARAAARAAVALHPHLAGGVRVGRRGC